MATVGTQLAGVGPGQGTTITGTGEW